MKKMVKTFKNQAAQGDLFLRRIKKLPAAAKPIAAPKDGRYVLAHSETGHHHVVMAAPDAIRLFGSDDPLLLYAEIVRPVQLKHERSFDTHETIEIGEGVYEIRRQREKTPDGWRRVED